jgi:hypothetical protein
MSSEPEPDPTTPSPAEPAEHTPESAAPEASPPTIPERPIPRGCNPLVFGVVAATIQLALTVYFMRTC